MKKITYFTEDIWYSAEFFKIDHEKDFDEQITERINDDEHWETELYQDVDFRTVMEVAKNVLKYSDYNYAMISLNRYTDWGTSEEVCNDCVCIGDIWADWPD